MSHTLTVRLTDEILDWLKETSRRTGIPVGRLIREQLEVQGRKTAFPSPCGSDRWRAAGCFFSQGIFLLMNGIADTGFIVAFARGNDQHHVWALDIAKQILEVHV
jgi:hypothetical protein